MGNPVVHFELNGPGHEEKGKFYSELFGWHTQLVPEMGYTVIDTHAGGGINGGLGSPPDTEPFVTFYVEADDLQASLDRAEALGGRTTMPVMEVPNVVTLAMFGDPAGNRIGLVEAGEGPGVSEGDNPPVDWFEILGGDAETQRKFYEELFGWSFEDASTGGFSYFLVDTGAGGRGANGAVGSSQDGRPKVNAYAHVDDLEKYCGRAESLGGTIVVPPMKVMDNLSIAHIADPQGTGFGLYVGG